MPRQHRIHYPGAWYHVMLRGNNGQKTFLSDGDRSRFCSFMSDSLKLFGCSIHSFCLMSNHIHLLVRIGEIPLSKFMQNLSFRYTQWFNKTQGRLGHLFQGRYKAFLVENEDYLLELVRYIHLNPVRAHLVKSPEDYLWSGHRAYLGIDTIEWLSTASIFSYLSSDPCESRLEYKDFIHKGITCMDEAIT